MEKPKWQREFEALPEWAKMLVRGLRNHHGYGFGVPDGHCVAGMSKQDRDRVEAVHFLIDRDSSGDFTDGVFGLVDLARSMSAPWPHPAPQPHKEMTTSNIVEMIQGPEDDCAFDQPCHYGHRVDGHAVYCHCDVWPDAPRKCRRDRDEHPHEECPGFYPNTNMAH